MLPLFRFFSLLAPPLSVCLFKNRAYQLIFASLGVSPPFSVGSPFRLSQAAASYPRSPVYPSFLLSRRPPVFRLVLTTPIICTATLSYRVPQKATRPHRVRG